jgi:hypothetical protein
MPNVSNFDFGEFLRQKRIQDAMNAHDPGYNPDDASHWLSTANKLGQKLPETPDSGPVNFSVDVNDKMPQDNIVRDQVKPNILTHPNLGMNKMEGTPLPESVVANRAATQNNWQVPEYKQPETPYYNRLQSQLSQAPQYEQPGKLRKILGGIVGAGTGLRTSNPFAAQAAGENFVDAPYNHKMRLFEQSVAPNLAASKAEGEHIKGMSEAERNYYRSRAEQERAGAEHERRNQYQYNQSDTAHQRKLEELQVSHPNAQAFFEAKLGNGKLAYLKRDQSGKLINTEDGLPVSMNAIDQMSDPNKSLKETKAAKLPAALQGSISAREILADESKIGTPEYEAAKDYIDELHKGKDPTAAFGAIVKKTNDERKARGQAEMSSAELTALQKTLQPVPAIAPIVTPDNKVIRPQLGQVLPPGSKPMSQLGETGTTRTMKEAAPQVISLANKVLAQVNAQEKSLGPAASRWSEFMAGKVGSPNPEFTGLRTNTALLQTLLMRMHVGASGRVAMMESFKDLIDSGKQSPENMRAAIQEIISYANDVSGKNTESGNSGSVPSVGGMFNGKKVTKVTEIK